MTGYHSMIKKGMKDDERDISTHYFCGYHDSGLCRNYVLYQK